MFSSVRRWTGDLTCEVLILTCFGNLPPDRQVYLGMGTMIVKETIRSWKDVSPLARELNSLFISLGVLRVRTSQLAQIDSDLYLSP